MARRNRSNPAPVAPAHIEVNAREPRGSWRDHPLAVAAVAVGATLVIGGSLVKDLIIPAHTGTLANQLAEYPAVIEQRDQLLKEVDSLKRKLVEAKSEVAQAQTVHVFSKGNPFPVGLDKFELGQPLSTLEAAYPGIKFDKQNKGYWAFNTDHGVVRHGAFYYPHRDFLTNREVERPTVRTVLLMIREDKFPAPYLHDKLISVLGQPTGRNDNDRLYWRAGKYEVELSSDFNFSISLDRTSVRK